ncbi:hypothetical protein PHSC3_001376 [Chlamydiales bacterium STE3]|nr:hypothetical protein PHSC3_001376 [Chlamydiales bacterium STE3]
MPVIDDFSSQASFPQETPPLSQGKNNNQAHAILGKTGLHKVTYLSIKKDQSSSPTIIKETKLNTPAEKIEKLRSEGRIVWHDEATNTFKMEERWHTFLQEHNVKNIVYKKANGEVQQLNNVRFQVLTPEESKKLNQSVDAFLQGIAQTKKNQSSESEDLSSTKKDSAELDPLPKAHPKNLKKQSSKPEDTNNLGKTAINSAYEKRREDKDIEKRNIERREQQKEEINAAVIKAFLKAYMNRQEVVKMEIVNIDTLSRSRFELNT